MTDRYESPLASRYASDAMLELFSAKTRACTWRKLWVQLAKAEMELGLPITQAQVDELAQHTDTIDFAAAARQIIEYVLDYASSHEGWHVAPDNREGVRISFDIDGELNSAWFLLRLSVHDPVMPLNAESDVPGGVRAVLGKLYEALKDQQGVDLAPLKAAL